MSDIHVHGFTRHLRWTDYKEVNESPEEPFAANTDTSIKYTYRAVVEPDGKWHVTKVSVAVRFVPESSWVVKEKKSHDLLKHEQAHYDIAAVAAATLYRKLRHLKGDSSQSADDAVKQIADEIVGDSGVVGRVQKRYDEDLICGTNHGLGAEQQAIWEHRILRAHLNAQGTITDLDSCPRSGAKSKAASGG